MEEKYKKDLIAKKNKLKEQKKEYKELIDKADSRKESL